MGPDKRRAAGLPFGTTAEVSRFAVAKLLRRPFEKSWCLAANRDRVPAYTDGTPMQLLTFGLVRSVVVMTSYAGISHIVGMMEPALLRLLGRLGIVFHRLGEPVEHHGLRQPGWAGVEQLVERARDCQPDLWEIAAAGCRFGGRPGLAHAG
jgi:N-acyl amino acid synthase of PEP-CTERM/exosortase system